MEIQFVEALGQYKLNIAQAELNEANAANEFEGESLRAVVVHELVAAMAHFRLVRYNLELQAAQWGKNGDWMSCIQNGENTTEVGITLMWRGYNFIVLPCRTRTARS